MNGTRILQLSGLSVDQLLPFSPRSRAIVYAHLKREPPPMWLLEAFQKWYMKNSPLQPQSLDCAFRDMLLEMWPKPGIEPSPMGALKGKPGRPPSENCFFCGMPLKPKQLRAGVCPQCGKDPRGPKGPKDKGDGDERSQQRTVQNRGEHSDAPAGTTNVASRVSTEGRALPADDYGPGKRADDGANRDTQEGGRSAGYELRGDFWAVSAGESESSDVENGAEGQSSGNDAPASGEGRDVRTAERDVEGVCGGAETAGTPERISPREQRLLQAQHEGGGAVSSPNSAGFEFTADDVNNRLRFEELYWAKRGNKRRSALRKAVLEQRPSWLPTPTDTALLGILSRSSFRRKERHREPDADLALRKERLASYTLSFVARIETKTHSKGAYQKRAWQDFRATILGLLDVPEWKAHAEELLGSALTRSKLESIFRQYFGGLSPVERGMDKYRQDTIGLEILWCGQVVQIDGSELPVDVLNAWGRTRRDGDLAQIFVACTDMGSLRTLIYQEATTSEVHLWDPAMQEWYFSLNFAPEKVIADEIGRSFNALRHLKVGQPPALTLGVRLWLAGGTVPHVHLPHRAQAKGAVECGGVKSFKSTLKRLLVAKWLSKEMRGCAPASYREVASEREWKEILAACEQALNARKLDRTQLTREQTWLQDEDGVKQRAERALAANARDTYRDICARARVWQYVSGQQIVAREDGKRVVAELRAPLTVDLRENPILVLPAGIRAGDEQYGDEMWRGLIVGQRPGQPTYHGTEVLCTKKNFLGFDLNKPTINEHPVARAETTHEQRKRKWAEAANPKVKTGTYDTPIDGDSPF